MNKGLFFMSIFILVCLVNVIGCSGILRSPVAKPAISSPEPAPAPIPARPPWVDRLPYRSDRIEAVGMARVKDIKIATEMATNQARAELSRKIGQPEVEVSTEKVGGTTITKTRTSTSATLIGVEKSAQWVDPETNTVYVLVSISPENAIRSAEESLRSKLKEEGLDEKEIEARVKKESAKLKASWQREGIKFESDK